MSQDKTMEGCAPENLLPCPFCGHDQDPDNLERRYMGPAFAFACVCVWCGATGPSMVRSRQDDEAGHKRAADKAWNHRTLQGEALPNPPDQPGSLQIEKQLNAPSAQGGK